METDERLRWIESRVASSLKPRAEELKQLFSLEENRSVFFDFLTDTDKKQLFIYQQNSVYYTSNTPPQNVDRKFIIILKVNKAPKITRENINSELFYMEWSKNPLDHFESLTRHMFLPILSTEQPGGSNCDKLMDLLHRITISTEVTKGKIEGSVTLGLPNIDVLTKAGLFSHRRQAVTHILETTLIGWIKQIKNTLGMKDECFFSKNYGIDPKPRAEIELWNNHLSIIHSINEQLCSPQVIKILTTLEDTNSSFAISFHNIKRDLGKAEAETLDNLEFLGTLEPYFQKISSTCDSKDLIKLFNPFMHTLLLVWTYSRYYHSPKTINHMFKMISNLIVSKARNIIGSDFLNDYENNKLRESLEFCAEFRGCYLDAKEKADAINQVKLAEQSEICEEIGVTWHSKLYRHARTPRGIGLFTKPKDPSEIERIYWKDAPWPARNGSVFVKLNKFMERCNDILELVDVTQQFNKVKVAANNCGIGDVNLNAQVVEIVNGFDDALVEFHSTVEDVLDLSEEHKFVESFFNFRSKIRDFEVQLGQILLQSMNQNWDAKSKLRLLEVFEGVTHRVLVQNILRQTLDSVLIHMELEIKSTAILFKQGFKPTSTTTLAYHLHLSPVTNHVLWLLSLKGRIEELFNDLTRVAPMCFKGEKGRELKDFYIDLKNEILAKKKKVIDKCIKSFDLKVLEKLDQVVLVRCEGNAYRVNLDAELQLCLKEIYDLTTQNLGVELPEEILVKIKNVDLSKIRAVAAQLFTATSQFSWLDKNMMVIEKSLIENHINKAKRILEEGVKTITWKDVRIADYVQDVVHVVCNECFVTSQIIQQNFTTVKEIMESWKCSTTKIAMNDDNLWPFTFKEYDKQQKLIASEVDMKVSSGCKKISQLVQKTFTAIHISKTTPEWMSYKEYIDGLVLKGLENSILVSLKYLYNSIVSKELEMDSRSPPMLQVSITLIGSIVYFVPAMDDTFAEKSMSEYFEEWLQDILSRADALSGMDLSCSVEEIKDSKEVQSLVERIKDIVKDTSLDCKKLVDLFKAYAFLWKQDVNYVFKEFLAGNITNRPRSNAEKEGQCNLRSVSQQEGRQSRAISSLGQGELRSGCSSKAGKDNSSGRSHSTYTVSSGLTCGVGCLQQLHGVKSRQKPTIEDFDEEIQVFQKAREELSNAASVHDMGWVSVNIQPIKQIIETYASKWMYTYTKYLSEQVHEILNSLDSFLKWTEPEIEAISSFEKDVVSLMGLMRIFNEVNCQQTELDSKFIQMKRMIGVLEKYHQKLPRETQQFYLAAPIRWNNLKLKINQAKQKLGPLIQGQQQGVIKILLDFKDQCMDIKFEMENSKLYNRDCDVSTAYAYIDQFNSKVNDIEKQAQDVVELQELLEKEVIDLNVIQSMKHELSSLQQVWDVNKLITRQQTEWKRHRWHKIKTKILKRGLEAQYGLVMKLPDEAHNWDVTLSVEEMINELMLCIPLMDDLRKASLRPRHWKQLARATGTSINFTSDMLIRMSLNQFSKLGLQNYAEEVRDIVKRSSKDVCIENMFKLYEEVWLSKVFELRSHTRLTSLTGGLNLAKNDSVSGSELGVTESAPELNFHPSQQSSPVKHTQSRLVSVTSFTHSVINDVDEDPDRFLVDNIAAVFEELHSHQLSLQEILNHPSAASFLDEITKWQKTLQNIELFIMYLKTAQEIWVKLNDVFNSVDIRMLMPKESEAFTSASNEFAAILNSIKNNSNILQISSKPNILYRLEKIESTLEQCSKVLINHLDKRRHRNPLFLLLSSDETRSILCKGYDPDLLCPHLSKLFGNMKRLETKVVESSNVYQIVGFHSVEGEYVPLEKPVLCENGVECWLAALRTAIQQTLHINFVHLVGVPFNDTLKSWEGGEEKENLNPSEDVNRNKSTLSGNIIDQDVGSTPLSDNKQMNVEQGADKSYLFNFLLKTVLPLADSWSMDGITDAVLLSVKLMVSNLLIHHFQAYIDGDQNAINELMETFQSAMVALSEFLFAQTKITIRRKSFEKPVIDSSETVNLASIDISVSTGSHKNIPLVKEDSHAAAAAAADKGHRELAPHQLQLLKNLIQLFANEKYFLENMLKQIETFGYDFRNRLPYDFLVHPKYSLDEETCELDVVLDQHRWTYRFDYQGVSRSSHVTLENERSLYWLSRGVKENYFGYLLGKQIHGSTSLLRTLSSMLGRHFFVYDITEQTTISMFTDVLKGASMSGSWICFKNLESLPERFFGLLTKSLASIKDALVKKKTSVTINNEEVTLLPSIAVFSLSHRNCFSPLPEELKKHFRVVSYTSPDILKLLEIGLIRSGMLLMQHVVPILHSFLMFLSDMFEVFSPGFGERKIFDLIQCIQENFKDILRWKSGLMIAKEISAVTSIPHPDSLNLELSLTDDIERIHTDETIYKPDDTHYPDDEIEKELGAGNKMALAQNLQYKAILLAVYQLYSPSLRPCEIALFKELMCETFKEINVNNLLEENIRNRDSRSLTVKLDLVDEENETIMEKDVDTIFRAIDLVARMNSYPDEVTGKIIQIAEMVPTSKLLCIVGNNKHFTWECINGYLTSHKKFDKKTKVDIISPFSLESKHVFGYFDDGTSRWRDGALMKLISSQQQLSAHFIVIDGKLYEDHVRFFCDILTKQGKFVLPNGDYMYVPDNVKFIVQTGSCNDLPPEIKCNTGVVSTDGFYPSWQLLLKKWVSTKNATMRNHLVELSAMYATETLKFMEKRLVYLDAEEKSQKEYHLVYTMLKMFHGLSPNVNISSDCYHYMNYAAFWSFFSLVGLEDRVEYSNWWKEKWSNDVCFPDDVVEVWDLIVNPETHLYDDVIDFHASIESTSFIQDGMYLSVSYLMTAMIDNGVSVILSGLSGNGKTSLFLDEYLHKKLEGGDVIVLMIHANEFLTCQSLWQQLNAVLEWKHSNFYHPMGNKKLVCFVKDLQHLQGDQAPVLDLLQQLTKHKKAYNAYKQCIQQLNDITFFLTLSASCTTWTNEAFQNLLNFIPIITFPDVGAKDQQYIFQTILENHFLTIVDRALLEVEILDDNDLDYVTRVKETKRIISLKHLLHTLVAITIELQDNMKKMFLEIPQRFHYVFTMRTLKRIFSQVCLTVPLGSTHEEIIRMWFYEVHWGYYYHLIDDVDCQRWKQELKLVAKKRLTQNQIHILEEEIPIFTNITIPNPHEKISFRALNADAKYQRSYSISQLQQYLKNNLVEYNKEHPKIKIYYYEETTRIVFRVIQVLQSPFSNGHVMLVAKSSPHIMESWIKQICRITQSKLFLINPSTISYERVYDINMFKSDLVNCMVKAGIKKEKMVFSITQLDMFDDKIIVLIDELLQKGTIPHIFNDEEKSSVINAIRTSGDQQKARLNKSEAWEFFIKSVHENLRVFIGLTSMDKHFQQLCLHHPSMIASMQLVCLPAWSEKQLVSNAKFILQEITTMETTEQEDLAHLFAALHMELQKQDGHHPLGKHKNITNTNYELFVERFACLYKNKKEELLAKKENIERTLDTIQQSMESVHHLKTQLDHEQTVVKQKRQVCSTLLTQIGQDRAITQEHTRLVEKTKSKKDKLQKLIPQYEEAHKRAVFKAAAIVKDTKEILNKLNDKELADLRSMQKPDAEIEDLLAAIIIIVKSPASDLTWNRGAKRMMANIERFKEEISVFDEAELPDSTLQVLRPYVNKPHFAPGYLANRTENQAIGSLVLYVRGVVRYNYMMQSHVKPLHQKISETSEKSNEVSEKHKNIEKKLKHLRNRLQALGESFEEACVEKSQKKELLEHLGEVLEKASSFETVLDGVTNDWKTSLNFYEEDEENLCSRIVLASAFSIYMGPYNESFRVDMLLKHWPRCLSNQGKPVKINNRGDIIFSLKYKKRGKSAAKRQNSPTEEGPLTQDPSFYEDSILTIAHYLTNEDVCRNWLTHGYHLHEIESLCMMNAPLKRTILCIDPMNKLTKLLPNIKLKDQELLEIDISERDNNFINLLERAISQGSLVVIKNIDHDIDQIFHSLIFLTCTMSNAGKQVIKVNGHRLQYNPKFRLILSSRLDHPNIPYEFASLCSAINMTPTDRKAEITLASLSVLKPTTYLYAQELLCTGFRNLFTLEKIDDSIMKDIQEKAGTYELWDHTNKLLELTSKRFQLYECLVRVDEEYAKLLDDSNQFDRFSEQLLRMYDIQHSLNRLQPYYSFTFSNFVNAFVGTLKMVSGLQEGSIHTSTMIYDVTELMNLSQNENKEFTVVEFPLHDFSKIHQPVSKQKMEMIMEEHEEVYLRNVKKCLSCDHYELFILAYFFTMKVCSEEEMSEQFVKVLLSVDEGVPKHSNNIKQPDWLSKHQFNALIYYAEQYSLIQKVVEILSQKPNALKSWCTKLMPELTEIPQLPPGLEPKDKTELQLLTVKSLRPDRFYFSLKEFCFQQMGGSLTVNLQSACDVLQSLNPAHPVLMLRDTKYADGVKLIEELASTQNVNIKYVVATEEASIDDSLTSTVQNDMFLVIEDLDLVHRDTLTALYNRLIRLHNLNKTSKWRIFFIAHGTENICEPLLKYCHVISLSGLTNQKVDSCLSWHTSLRDAIVCSINRIPTEVWDKLLVLSLKIRTLTFSMCVLDGFINAYYVRCSNASTVSLSSEGLLNAIKWVIQETENDRADEFLFHEVVEMLFKDVYGSLRDRDVIKSLAMTMIWKTAAKELDSILIGSLEIPLPPMNVEPSAYATWFAEKFTKSLENNPDVGKTGVRNDDIQRENLKRSNGFLKMFGRLYHNKEVVEYFQAQTLYENIMKCKESLPNVLDVKELNYGNTRKLMKENIIQAFLTNEYLFFNKMILSIKSTLTALQQNISGGELTIPSDYYSEAVSLSRGYAPSQWLKKHRLQKRVQLLNWFQEMHITSKHLRQFYNEGCLLAQPNTVLDALFKVNLCVFNDITALFAILKYVKSLECDTTSDDVYLKLRIISAEDEKTCVIESNQMVLLCEELYLQGACVVADDNKNVIVERRENVEVIEKLPSVCIWADVKDDDEDEEEQGFRCPVYIDAARQELLFTVVMETKARRWNFTYSNPAIFLSP